MRNARRHKSRSESGVKLSSFLAWFGVVVNNEWRTSGVVVKVRAGERVRRTSCARCSLGCGGEMIIASWPVRVKKHCATIGVTTGQGSVLVVGRIFTVKAGLLAVLFPHVRFIGLWRTSGEVVVAGKWESTVQPSINSTLSARALGLVVVRKMCSAIYRQ